MAIDHSAIYKDRSLKNIGHRARARAILQQIERFRSTSCERYYDVGCSNGYLTAKVAAALGASETVGWDHAIENIEIARNSYPKLSFRHIDLNKPVSCDRPADIVTCFETMEHVGNVEVALSNLQCLAKAGGTIFVTVPIESGPIGAVKYLLKRGLLGYKLDELTESPRYQREYTKAVLSGGRISRFRSNRSGWSTHFGFDYRDFEDLFRSEVDSLRAWTVGTTRFLVATNRGR